MQQLNEGLSYMDMEHQVLPVAGIDVYKTKIGTDDDISTINFTVKAKAVAEDLVDWLERGYDWVLDADTSPGEIANGKYLVFVDVNRRTSLPGRVMEMLADLETLTGIEVKNWKLQIGDKKYPASAEEIKNHIALSPQQYREENDSELNEWRDIAGIQAKPMFDSVDPELLAMQRQAGIK